MKAAVFTKNDNPTHNFPATVIKNVDFEITRQEIEDQQEQRMCHDAETLCRIKILDEETGKYVWFDITPTMRRGKPGVEVTAIGNVNETSRKNVTGTWRSDGHRWRVIVIEDGGHGQVDSPLPEGSQIWLKRAGQAACWSDKTDKGEFVAGQDLSVDSWAWESVKIRVPV